MSRLAHIGLFFIIYFLIGLSAAKFVPKFSGNTREIKENPKLKLTRVEVDPVDKLLRELLNEIKREKLPKIRTHFNRDLTSESGCPSDWDYYEAEKTCIFMEESSRNWDDARQACDYNTNGLSHLVKINSQEKLNFVLSMSSVDIASNAYWFGLNDKEQEGVFKWEDETEISDYSNWIASEPNGGTGENCVELKAGYQGQWNDWGCSGSHPFICEISESDAKALNCPLGMAYYEDEGTCIYMEDSSKNWEDAQQACRSNTNEPAGLVKLNSEKKLDFVLSMKDVEVSSNAYWFGLNDMEQEGVFKWEDGTGISDYSNWIANEPNGGTGENCVELKAGYQGQWNDWGCSGSHPFICEFTSSLPPTIRAPTTTQSDTSMEEENEELKCLSNEIIRIVSVFYGNLLHGCRDSFALDIIKNRCEGLNLCSMPPHLHTLFGNPCPADVQTLLKVDFECDPFK